ncbi:anhydro-N-acetylmuramic acid kinase [Methyloceanibacter sp.]|uniref:anhydro-N-acetylmuramic acid kinase n=1 Tax=Methyloceanibacter sp. TaxID=1965321 RepID=UPI003D6D1F74
MMTVIGMMSAAALEGIDVALVATDGERRLERRQSLTFPLSPEQREDLNEAIAKGRLAKIEQDLVEFCADAVKHFLESFALTRDAIALIGLETETAGRIDFGEALARATGIDVVYDFASADIDAGGQGRPLDPVYHRALAEAAGIERPLVVVETGTRTTVTYIGEDGSLMAFDVGSPVTARAVVDLTERLPARPLVWLLAGGADAALLEALGGLLGAPIHRAEEMGWPADHFAAETFAYLAVRSMRKLPLSFPGTTGVKQPITGGRLARAPRC